VTLGDAPNSRGGTWGDDGNIVFTPDFVAGTVVMRVPSAGGKPEPLTKLGESEVTHRFPQALPGAKAVLYSANSATTGWDQANIVVQPLPAGTPRILVRGGYQAKYLRSGHLVYLHDATLFTVPFDLDRLEVTGPSVPVVENVNTGAQAGHAQFGLSDSGALVYLPGQNPLTGAPILWMSRDGKTTPLRSMAANWSNPQFAPDGQRLAVDIAAGRQLDVWVYEWARDTLTRFTFDPANDQKPVWTPDGRRIVFGSSRDKVMNLYWQRADGTGEIQRLTESPNVQVAGSWHPSGKYLGFTETNAQTKDDLMILPIEGNEKSGWKPGKPTVFLNSPALEEEPMFSPDGRWIAYQSNESGRMEVFVRPFPGPGGKWQISTAGGDQMVWSRTRHELFYRTLDGRIMVAAYTVEGDSFKADKPRVWSDQSTLPRPRQRVLDLHPDGERFAVSAATGPQAEEKHDKVVFIFNFFDELRRIAPAGGK
jgi:dipeptidyl aminopeptidase/acylaminoacyl peptidase